MRVRSATPDDIPSMMALERHAATAAHWSLRDYQSLFDTSAVRRLGLVMEEEGGVQGFLVAQRLGREWEIENIAVAGRARRRGLGTRLLGEFLDRARSAGARLVFLQVRQSNRAARALYEKWAFRQAGQRNDYYSDPTEAAVVYEFAFF